MCVTRELVWRELEQYPLLPGDKCPVMYAVCTPAIPCIRAAVARIGNDAEPVICMNFSFKDSKQISAFCVAFAIQIRNNSVSLLRLQAFLSNFCWCRFIFTACSCEVQRFAET
jgi:hypothetical protein